MNVWKFSCNSQEFICSHKKEHGGNEQKVIRSKLTRIAESLIFHLHSALSYKWTSRDQRTTAEHHQAAKSRKVSCGFSAHSTSQIQIHAEQQPRKFSSKPDVVSQFLHRLDPKISLTSFIHRVEAGTSDCSLILWHFLILQPLKLVQNSTNKRYQVNVVSSLEKFKSI